MHTPLQLFYCYAREDRLLRDELDRHLVPLKRTSRIITWHDGEIVAGEQWAQKITEQLNTAHLILLLVSSHFLASDYCYGVEMKQALARHEADQACVIPILVSPADWADAPFSRIQILPPEAKAVTEWSHRDMAWYEVVKGIKAALTRAEKYLADEKDKAPLSPKEKRLLDAKHYEQGFRPLAVSADEEQDSLRSLRSGKERESSIPSAKDPMAQELEEREIALDPSFLFNYDKDPALSELGWRHYASRSLLLALRLLCEDINDAYAGLILPAQNSSISDSETHQDLSTIPRALVGWLERIRSFSLFLKPESAFEFPNNYTVLPLRRLLSDDADFSKDRTLLVVERQRVRLQIDKRAIRVVYRLLRPLYEDQQNWRTYFGNDVRDLVYPGIDFTPKVSDVVLNGLADMVVRLGGKKRDGQDRWRYCCILLPDNPLLPLQQRGLVVRAKSAQADRHIVGVTTVLPERYWTSLSLRAYQSGHILYRPELAREFTTAYLQKLEDPVRSNIAVPVGGETEPPLGVLYVASNDPAAFPPEDHRLLRVMTRIIEELLRTYQARQKASMDLTTLIDDPVTVDNSFKEFPSETDFMQDLEDMLTEIREQIQTKADREADGSTPLLESGNVQQEISFIAIELDGQERIGNRYGDQTLKNVYKAVGLRIWGLLSTLFSHNAEYKLYYMSAGRFYLLLRGFSLEETRGKAERLRKVLEGSIHVRQSDLPGGSLIVPKLSAHLAVTWHTPEKLKEFLDPAQHRTIADVSSTFCSTLDFGLSSGANEGGNVTTVWDRATRIYTAYLENEESISSDSGSV